MAHVDPGAASLALLDSARRLVDDAEADPVATIERAEAIAHQASAAGETTAQVHALWAVGVAARLVGRVEVALDRLDLAVTLARGLGLVELEGRVRTTRAASRFTAGQAEAAFADLDWAVANLEGEALGIALFQRATVASRAQERASYLTEALDLLRSPAVRKYAAGAHLNLGLLAAYDGACELAFDETALAQQMYADLGLDSFVAMAEHNLGFVAARAGDFPRAFDHFGTARHWYEAHGHPLGPLVLDYADALLDVGLADEAATRAAEAVELLLQQGNLADAAEGMLLASAALQSAGDPIRAQTWGVRSRQAFVDQERAGWSDSAELQLMRIRAVAGELTADDLSAAEALASRLAEAGLRLPALNAMLVGAQAAAQAGDVPGALASVHRIRADHGSLPVSVELPALTTEAELCEILGRIDEADRLVSLGADVLERSHASIGASDPRAYVSSHARALMAVGRRLAYRSGDGARLFRRVEQSRASALRYPPARPPADAADATVLAELRATYRKLRQPDVDDAIALDGRRAHLERLLADTVRRTRAPAGPPAAVIDAGDVLDALGDASLVLYAEVDDELHAVVLDQDLRVVRLAPRSVIRDLGIGAGLVLRRLARPDRSVASAARDLDHLRDTSRQLAQLLIQPLRLRDRAKTVLVPPAWMSALPWGSMLADRPFSVAPSATVWRRAIDQDRPSPSSVALIAGPDLHYAMAEIAALQTCRPHSTVLAGEAATCEHVIGALVTHDTAHVAAHYVAKRGNPLFSSMRLADGDLFVHELAALSRVPRLLVLAACDSAVSTVRPVDEVLGAAAALLSLGARDVIASCTVVPDCDATIDFADRLHRALVADEEPAVALVQARALVADRGEPAAAVVAAGFIAMGA